MAPAGDSSFAPNHDDWKFVQSLSRDGSAAASPLPSQIPVQGIGDRSALEALYPLAIRRARSLGAADFLAHMDPPTPWFTWVTAAWAASQNQNLLHPDTSPEARDLEVTVTNWFASAFGMDGGHLVPGSTVANLTALWAAREVAGVKRVVASTAAHLSVAKAAHILGLDFERVPVDSSQAMLGGELGDLTNAALVLTAGTTATGAIDSLDLAGRAAWTHVDAAWAGPMVFSEHHAAALDGIERADSLNVSAHKWLFQPKESAIVLFKHAEGAHQAISFGGDYLAVPNVGLLGSHGAAAALSLAATVLAWGSSGIGERIDRCMAIAGELADLVASSADFELRQPPSAGVVVWRPVDCRVDERLDAIAGVVVSRTVLDGEPWFRSVAANPMGDPAAVISTIGEAGE